MRSKTRGQGEERAPGVHGNHGLPRFGVARQRWIARRDACGANAVGDLVAPCNTTRVSLHRWLRRALGTSRSRSTAAPAAAGCSRSSTTSTRSGDRSGAAWMKLFDDRYMRSQWPYGSGVWGKREWVMPMVPDDAHRVHVRGRHATCSGPSATARSSGLDELWVKLCGNSHSGSLQGPRHDRAGERGAPRDAARARRQGHRLRLYGRHQRVARGLRCGRGAAGGRALAAGQDLDGPAGAAAGPRRAGPGPRHRLRRLHGASSDGSPTRASSTSPTR